MNLKNWEIKNKPIQELPINDKKPHLFEYKT